MRRVLIDTQVALWLLLDDEKLPQGWLSAMSNRNVDWYFHQISLLEIQIKYNLGKLPLPQRPEIFILPALKKMNFQYITLQNEAIYFLAKLPSIHRDPFDRLLVAHALVNGWELATTDKVLQTYPVKIFS